MLLAFAKCVCLSLTLMFSLAQQEAGTPIGEDEGEQQQQKAESQPTASPSQTPPVQADVKPTEAEPTRHERQDQQQDAASDVKKPMTLAETLTLILSVLTFCVIAFQTYIYKGQLGEMRKLRGVTERQAGILETQVGAMQGQLEVMQTQTAAMQDSLAETRKIVEQNERAVIASETQAKAAEQNAAIAQETFYVAERAYLSLQRTKTVRLVAGKSPYVEVWMFNGGRTPATHVTGRSRYVIASEPVYEAVCDEPHTSTEAGSIILAGDRQIHRLMPKDLIITEADLSAIHSGELKLMILGDVRYKDFRGEEQVYSYRGMYDPENNDFFHY